MFIGRNKELQELEKIYKKDKFECLVVYGRRRVGKTTLLLKFIEDKPNIFFTAIEGNEKQNLENLSEEIFGFENIINPTYNSFQEALEAIFIKSLTERIILVIDEYPNLAKSSKSVASTLQYLIDKYKDQSKLMLILCGSSISFMEEEVLAYKAPLYGRKTGQFKIEPFEFKDVANFFPSLSLEEKAQIYGIFGGTPHYLKQYNTTLSIKENIKDNFFNSNSFLFDEPQNLLKEEVREVPLYYSVISAIASGANKLSEISNLTGEGSTKCVHYINNLLEMGLVKKEFPYNVSKRSLGIYSIDDPLFKFWFRFIPKNSNLIYRGIPELVLKRVEPYLNEYMGPIFERICIEYLWELLIKNKSPVNFYSLGRWWGSDITTKSQVEIDIIGEEDKKTALFAECKWTTKPVGLDILETLIHRSRNFSYINPYYFLFSKSGFTPELIEFVKDKNNISLISLEDIAAELEIT